MHQSAFIYGETDQFQNCYDQENIYGQFDQQSQQSNSFRGGGSRILSKHSQSRYYANQNLTQQQLYQQNYYYMRKYKAKKNQLEQEVSRPDLNEDDRQRLHRELVKI